MISEDSTKRVIALPSWCLQQWDFDENQSLNDTLSGINIYTAAVKLLLSKTPQLPNILQAQFWEIRSSALGQLAVSHAPLQTHILGKSWPILGVKSGLLLV